MPALQIQHRDAGFSRDEQRRARKDLLEYRKIRRFEASEARQCQLVQLRATGHVVVVDAARIQTHRDDATLVCRELSFVEVAFSHADGACEPPPSPWLAARRRVAFARGL